MYKTERINFALDEKFKKQIDDHVKMFSDKYEDRTDFLNLAIRNLIEEDTGVTTKEALLNLTQEISDLKILINIAVRNTNNTSYKNNSTGGYQYRRD
ncbi:ribbon-helix-helix domain-containing protein [Nosocomiicoccus sp. HMSC059G07]|uniref:ribbon-helix-helix domain-containing protein n=1 Tax=Nosocomiicoccus sp. HMSC059G07 TaxID=1739531 RepID=UPI0008A633EF|nr:ribbon-helix-helix domain-containing protein [Nosocomiicoccus sp. HMSC059G07]OFO55293.1 hypothetical protein HMPREF3029_04550 [Nosocomiicoccus sp. HMSC059G07]